MKFNSKSTGANTLKKSDGKKNDSKSFKNSKGKINGAKTFKKNIEKITPELGKQGRIIVRNLPFSVSETLLKEHFCKYGAIKDVDMLKRQDGKPMGCAFIEYDTAQNAVQAIENCSGKDFMGRTITAAVAVEQSRYVQNRAAIDREHGQGTHVENSKNEVKHRYPEVKEGRTHMKPPVDLNDTLSSNEMSLMEAGKGESKVKKQKKVRKDKNNISFKKGRIIVRNIAFKATEDDLKKHFSPFGELAEVSLLKKPDGKLVGCAFVQFQKRQHAAKAIMECSGKPFLGRPIVIDWCLPKSNYIKKNAPEQMVEVKKEPISDKDIKQEDDEDVKYSAKTTVKLEDESDTDSENDDDMDQDDEEDTDSEEDVKELTKKHQKLVSNDVSEGRTVFVKNIPFSASNEEFKKCMEQFGDTEYALICYDQLTEHSKGTGFVKYKTMESTQTCLSAGTELTLLGQVLDCHKALDRETIQAKGKKNTDNVPSKDSRNLYLIKEGVVLAGSKAAANVSVTDMAKRLQLEQLKTQMLRNLNMFVSNTRLAIHNLPPSYDDAKLFDLFKKHSKPGATITESKVMRDRVNVDENGVGKSKEMGFVRFMKHEDALHALRTINNNPDVFTVNKRPIVAFAIENRMVHKVRQQREQKSRDKNPLFKKKDEGKSGNATKVKSKSRRVRRRVALKLMKRLAKALQGQSGNDKVTSGAVPNNKLPTNKPVNKKDAKTAKKLIGNKKGVKQLSKQEGRGAGDKEFTGIAAAPGDTKLRTKYNLKAQATLHMQTVRRDTKKKKSSKMLAIQREAITQPKQKKGKGKKELSAREEASFAELVNKYKSKMAIPSKEKKWYEPEK